MERRLVKWTAGVLVYAVADALMWAPDYGGTYLGSLRSFVQSLGVLPIGLMAYALTMRFPLGRRPVVFGLVHCCGLVVAPAIKALWALLVNDFTGRLESVPSLADLYAMSFQSTPYTYVIMLGAAHTAHFRWLHREREVQLAEARAQLAQAELQALRSQIRPHFLFNALNTIVSYVHQDPHRAERMIVRLSTLLRRSLEGDGAVQVPLRTDLDVLGAYLEIEQARFEDRLSVRWEIAPAVMDALVPPLLLQPLAENAVRHGIAPRPAPGGLTIRAGSSNGSLRLTVEDDGVGLPVDGPTAGIGLANVRSRLDQLYGDRHRFTVEPRPGGGVVATVTLPLRLETA